MDAALYDKCARENIDKVRLRDIERELAEAKWSSMIAAAAAKGVLIPV